MRKQIRFDPAHKEFEVFLDFAGGMNSEIANERLRDNEFPVLENVDLSGRGSAKRRSGRTLQMSKTGNAQGAFFYYRKDQTYPDILLAVSGRLYLKATGAEIPITDSGAAWTFQTLLSVEAVQYGTALYIATGTKLVQVTYNSANSTYTATTVVPYTPTVQEAIYIGTNALAPNPSAYIQDGVSAALEIAGVSPAKRTGTVRQNISMTVFINKPASIINVDYKWEYRLAGVAAWTMGRDWTANATGKSWNFNVNTPGTYEIQVTVRDNAVQTTTATYIQTGYVVNAVEDKENNDLPYVGLQTCRGILLHWDRIMLYKDATNPFQVYVSDLENPAYIPVTHTVNFDTGKQEPVTALVRFQNMLVAFTKTTVQTLVGKAPIGSEAYTHYLIHDGLGCTADWSPKVVGNTVIFQSDEGYHRLKPNPYRLETMNVERIDAQIKSELPHDSNACALVHDSQYWICFPSRNLIYRYYYEQGVWVRDASPKLNFRQFLQYGDDVYNLTLNGELYLHSKTVYNDAGYVYDMAVEAKFHDLSASFNYKKLKRLYVMAKHYTYNVNLKVTVQADSAIVLTPDSGKAVVNASDEVVWATTSAPNMSFLAGTTFGAWLLGKSPWGDVALSVQKATIRGKCRRVKIKFLHSQDGPCELFGYGYEYKIKKP